MDLRTIVDKNSFVRAQINWLLALLFTIAGCAIDPPPSDGLWVYVDGKPQQLDRYPYKSLVKKLLDADFLEKIPRIDKPSQIVVKHASSADFTATIVVNPVEGEEEVRIAAHQSKKLEKDSVSHDFLFERIPEGYVLFRIKGKSIGGYYPAVINDSEAWSVREGNSYYQQKQYAKAAQSFARAVEFSESSDNLGWLARSQIDAGDVALALGTAEDALDAATEAKDSLVWTGGLHAEAMMLNGKYKEGLGAFDRLRERYPANAKLERHLGRLLEGVEPQPGTIVQQIHEAAFRGGNDAVEKYMFASDLDASGSEARLTSFVRKCNAGGRVKHLQIKKTQRVGRSAVVHYDVRFADGSKYDRSMNFYLGDNGSYQARLD